MEGEKCLDKQPNYWFELHASFAACAQTSRSEQALDLYKMWKYRVPLITVIFSPIPKKKKESGKNKENQQYQFLFFFYL